MAETPKGPPKGRWSGGQRPGGFRGGKPAFGKGQGSFRPRSRGERIAADPEAEVILYGWHPVSEALRNRKRRFRRLLATENAYNKLVEEGLAERAKAEIVRPDEIDRRLSADAVHQGLYAECDALPGPRMESLAPEGVVLVLDQVTDPHNVGAILRTAAAFDVKAVITTARHSPEATGVLAKSASGGLEHVPFVLVRNLAVALNTLKERGFQTVGLDSDAPADLAETPLQAPVALVLGAEGKGLRQLTRTTCDVLARLDMPGAIRSLNVSNAAALALFVATRRTSGGAI